MSRDVTPMIHVPDVDAAVAWYRKLGFAVETRHACDDQGGPLTFGQRA